MSLTKKELDDLRAETNRLGMTEASEKLGVHKTSIIRALAGLDIRPRTEQDIRDALVRGERRGNSPTTKRKA